MPGSSAEHRPLSALDSPAEVRRPPVAKLCREGRSGPAILVSDTLLAPAEMIAERLNATPVNMRFVKPLDADRVIDLAVRHRALVTIEEVDAGP
jgi:1-deoxy-D-xylulose-5-phosphate synthase